MYLNSTKEKVKISKIKNGIMAPDELTSDLCLYKRRVKNETYKWKKIIFEKWNGYDYYDNEYIKNNLSLKSTDRLYPTIDHKDSILYGFLNNIFTGKNWTYFKFVYNKKTHKFIKKGKIDAIFKLILSIFHNPLEGKK